MEVLKSRKPNRLKEYDYSSSGYYFVTICAHNHKELFGRIENNKMYLNDTGIMIDSIFKNLPQYYPQISIDTYVIMPNHIHAIIVIENYVGAGLCAGPDGQELKTSNGQALDNGQAQRPVPTRLSLSDIIQRFKSFTARQYAGTHLWQRSYYDHVIIKDESLDEIRKYIFNNPCAWMDDEENVKSAQWIDNGQAQRPVPTNII